MNQADPTTEEAAGWLVRLQSADATADDRAAFQAWLAGDPARAAAYAGMQSLWGNLGRLRLGRRPSRTRQAAVRTLPLVALAAILGAVLSPRLIDRLQADHYTSVGEVGRITLDDGSVAYLNTDTAIEVDYSAGARRIHLLRGEAFFDVVADPARPFVVDDGQLTATALGTKYGVEVAPVPGVVVEQGQVRVEAGAGRAELGPDEAVRLTEDGSLVREAAGDAAAWREGRLVFSDQPLGAVLATLERYRLGRILVLDDRAAAVRVSGVFDLKDTDQALKVLEGILPIRVDRVTDMLVIVHGRE